MRLFYISRLQTAFSYDNQVFMRGTKKKAHTHTYIYKQTKGGGGEAKKKKKISHQTNMFAFVASVEWYAIEENLIIVKVKRGLG